MSFRVRRIEEERPPRIPWRSAVSAALLLARPLAAVVRRVWERRERERRWHRLLAISTAAAVALGIAALTFSLFLHVGTLSFVRLAEKTGTPLAVDQDGFTNILLLGQGDEDHDGIDLTDTIIVVSIDADTSRFGASLASDAPHSKKTPSVVLLSLPRDLYFLHTDAMGPGKLNTFWRDGRIRLQHQGKERSGAPVLSRSEASLLALREVAKEVGGAVNLPIHYAVKVDFTAFKDIVDAVGGIDITVPETIEDTEFPGPNYTYETLHIDAGLQHLDGDTALKYARTRHTSSDFDRSKRQEQILRALVETAKTSGLLKRPRKLLELFAILREHLETDLTTREIITLATLGLRLSPDRVAAMQLSDVNGLYDTQLLPGGLLYAPPRTLFEGAFVLLPVSIPEFPVTWKQVHTLTELLFRHRELFIGTMQFAVFNAGAPEGSARSLARELTKFGFTVAHVGNVPGKEDRARSSITRVNPALAEEHAAFFSRLLGLPMEPLPEDVQAAACGAEHAPVCVEEHFGDMTIILGEDFTFQFFQDLLPISAFPTPHPHDPS